MGGRWGWMGVDPADCDRVEGDAAPPGLEQALVPLTHNRAVLVPHTRLAVNTATSRPTGRWPRRNSASRQCGLGRCDAQALYGPYRVTLGRGTPDLGSAAIWRVESDSQNGRCWQSGQVGRRVGGMTTSTPSSIDKVRENRLRRAAERQGYRLMKARRRDRRAFDYGTYQLVDGATNSLVLPSVAGGGFGYQLDEIEERLTADEDE